MKIKGCERLDGFVCSKCCHLSQKHLDYLLDCSECECEIFTPRIEDLEAIKKILIGQIEEAKRRSRAPLN